MGELRKIDVREIIRSKSPSLGKRIPSFIIRYLEKTVHQEEINEILRIYSDLKDREFVAAVLDYMGITYRAFGTGNLPPEGRFVFASNHPLGGLDGLVFINEVSKHYPSVKFPVNDLLLNIPNFSGIFLAVNKHGSQARDSALTIEKAYASDDQILYFPAGLCSRRRRGKISDLDWQKSFINKAVWHRRDIIPVYFSGRNSNFFYSLASARSLLGIRTNIEMLWLPDEMFSQKGRALSIVFGKPVPWQTFDKKKNATQWAEFVKRKTYDLAGIIEART
ncbi:MAG: glycerol acyltransferase [Bacteroidales bacterium]|jgi:putative hemolysin|nr:glycerol acyltransferase [Bacteroidales bacterium]